MSGFAEQARQALVSAKWTHRRTYLLEVRRMKKKKMATGKRTFGK